ncbi:kinase-like domain-containing protein [Irpex rosettiformis]|uniref:Kinase-like domain-containing protein n=1 Tax=Irpex rosettiformis TaxID=378272 RepID=A0ACB8TSW4_9APHY|nr:kinase-like domain-containing protein [Irpex rosettiformis]
MLSSVQFWVSLFWWHSYFGLSSVLMLCSFGQSLDDQKLEPIYSINTRLAFALCSLWALFRQYIIKPWRPRSPELRQQFPDGDRTLLGYLMAHHHMSAKDASYVFSQVLDAVDHLHSKGFIHCDIKPSNILTGADLKVKLIDFGNAIELPKDWDASRGPIVYRPSNGIFGTVVVYTAREILYNSRFIPQGLDVWAMGVVLFEILTGYRPFEDQDSIMSYTINYDLDQVTGIEGLIKMWLIVRGCLDTDPFTRKTLASLRDPRGIQPFSVWKVELSKEELQMIGQSV